MHRRTVLAAGAAVALARPAIAQRSTRVLRFVPEGSLHNPDPVCSPSATGRNHGFMIWDTLYGLDRSFAPSPQMAAGHETSDDRLTWRFTLRDGLIFHDNTPVRAPDCVASILRWARRRPLGQAMLARLHDIRALDDRRFELRLKLPFSFVLEALGSDTCFIMPERIASADPASPVREFIGSGPFRFLHHEWAPASKAAYARWEKYLPIAGAPDFTSGGKVAHFDRVEWIILPDPATAAAALQQGVVDWVQQPQLDLLPVLRDAPGVAVVVHDTVGVMPVLALNHLHPPFDNPLLRRALLPALEQLDFVQAAVGSEPELIHVPAGVFTPGLPMASDAGLEVLAGPRDPGLTRRLVTESGYGGEKLLLLSPADAPAIQGLSQVARDLFEQAGLNVEYVSLDWAALQRRRSSREPVERGGWSAFCTTWEGLALATPATHLPLRGTGLDGWFGWPTSPRLEALRQAWFAAPDLATQCEVCAQMQLQAWQEVPYLPLGQWFNPTALRDNLIDVVKAPFPLFWGARKL